MRNFLPEALIAVSMMFTIASCREPATCEKFIKSSKTEDVGRYVFDVDFSDSLSVYDILMYTEFEGKTPESSFPVIVHWASPSGMTFSERVYWNPETRVVPYREEIEPFEYGDWKMTVNVGEYPKIYGLGIVVRKNGTR